MLKRTLLPLAALCLMLAVSCGPSFRHIQVRSLTEAQYLRAEAAAANLQGEEITIAEGFLARAQSSTKEREAADLADVASAHYRLALARHSLATSGEALNRAEAALKVSMEQVSKYEQILGGLNQGGRQ